MVDRGLVDTNVIVRFLKGSPEAQAEKAQALFERAWRGEIEIEVHPSVLSGVIYVAMSPHGLDLERGRVAGILREFMSMPGITIDDRSKVLDGLERFQATSLDWVDALLLSYTPQRTVYSFDGKMTQAGARQL